MGKGIFEKAYINNLPENPKDSFPSKIDPAQMDKLVNKYSVLIKYIAFRIAKRLPSHVELDDLISSGVLGLIDAIKKFDPSRGALFKTYAEFRIKGAILDELRSMDWVPRSVRQKFQLLEKASVKLEHKLGRSASDEEIAQAMGVSLEEYYDITSKASHIPLVSLNDLGINGQNERKSLMDCLAGAKDLNPQVHVRLSELKQIIANAIEDLEEKERLMISLYYYEELTMKEIGEVLGITESRVSQIHSKAVIKLKIKLKKHITEYD